MSTAFATAPNATAAFPTGLPADTTATNNNANANANANVNNNGTAARVYEEGPKMSSITVHTVPDMRGLLKSGRIKEGKLVQRKNGIGFDTNIDGKKGNVRVQFGRLDNPLTTPFGVKLPELSDKEKAEGKGHKDPYRKNLDVGVNKDRHADYTAFGKEWDEHYLNVFTNRSQELFKKQKSREVVDDGFLKTIRPPAPPKNPDKANAWDAEKAKEWDPLHRFKVVTEGVNATRVKKIVKTTTLPNGKKKYVRVDAHADEITAFCKVVVIADCIGGWIAGGQHGVSWQATDIMFFPAEDRNLPSEFKTGDDEEFEDVDVDPTAAVGANEGNDVAVADEGNTMAAPVSTAPPTAPASAPTSAPPQMLSNVGGNNNNSTDLGAGPTVISPMAAASKTAAAPTAAAGSSNTDGPPEKPRKRFAVPMMDDEDDEPVKAPPSKQFKMGDDE